MAKFDVFVGREKELELIEKWAEKWGTTHLVALQGDGGVGKTWLLLEIMRRYGKRDDFVVVYWDYAEHPGSGISQVAGMYGYLGIEDSGFLDGLTKLEGVWIPDDVEKGEDTLFEISVRELKPFLQEKRLIYLADTTELLSVSTERMDRYASRLPNVLFISAGRDIKGDKLEGLREIYGPDNVTYMELYDFSRVESREFFNAVDEEGNISPDMRSKLHFLTNGRPVLLSLAVDWLSHEVPLPEIAGRSLDELDALPEAGIGELREKFEFELVDRVRRLREPLDRAVLYIAHVSRRGDARLLSAILDISGQEAEELMVQLSGLSFVKYNPVTGNCMLHDEMKNLVNRHAWPYVDPTGDVRRKLARKVIEGYYEPRIRELSESVRARLGELDRGQVGRAEIGRDEWEQWRLEAECLYYHLQIGEKEGFLYFEDRFAEAQRNNHLMRMQFLLGEMEVSGHADVRDTVEIRRAAALRRAGEIEAAARIFRRMLEKDDLSVDNRIDANAILGYIASSDDPEEARGLYETAMRLAREKGDDRKIGILYNNMGQLELARGLPNLAVEHFLKAIDCGKRTGDQHLATGATSNLAHTYRLQGNLVQADVMCRVAIAQRKKMGDEVGLAYSYLVKGEIDRERGDLESAEHYSKLGLRSFDKLSEKRGLVRAYRSLANLNRHLERFEDSEAYLERGIQLAKENQDEPLLSSLLNVYGREQRDRALHLQAAHEDSDAEMVDLLFQRAEKYLRQSLELAMGYGDPWLLARGQLELAVNYTLSGSRTDDEIEELLETVWENASRIDEKLILGYVEELRGTMALRKQNFSAAARHLGSAALLIAHRPGREQERFFARLGDSLLNPNLTVEATKELVGGVLETIPRETSDEALVSLQMLCSHVLDMQDIQDM